MALLGWPPFYKGKKIAPLYMQSLVPRVIAIIEFGADGDNCAVKYQTTKMADKRSILAVNSIFLALASLAAVHDHLGFSAKCRHRWYRVSRQSDSNSITQKLTLLGG